MKVGVTATRWGVDERRLDTFKYIIEKLGITHFDFGMCVGGDTQAYKIVRSLDKTVWVKGHPPIEQGQFFSNVDCDDIAKPKDYLSRDRDIVDESEVMIAMPKENTEKRRSGTWYTVRYAKKVIKSDKGSCKKLYIILPNGKVEFFDFKKLTK